MCHEPQVIPFAGPTSVNSSSQCWVVSVSPPPEKAWRSWSGSRQEPQSCSKRWKLGPIHVERLKEWELFCLGKKNTRKVWITHTRVGARIYLSSGLHPICDLARSHPEVTPNTLHGPYMSYDLSQPSVEDLVVLWFSCLLYEEAEVRHRSDAITGVHFTSGWWTPASRLGCLEVFQP